VSIRDTSINYCYTVCIGTKLLHCVYWDKTATLCVGTKLQLLYTVLRQNCYRGFNVRTCAQHHASTLVPPTLSALAGPVGNTSHTTTDTFTLKPAPTHLEKRNITRNRPQCIYSDFKYHRIMPCASAFGSVGNTSHEIINKLCSSLRPPD
jgi:hypothetical protein